MRSSGPFGRGFSRIDEIEGLHLRILSTNFRRPDTRSGENAWQVTVASSP